MAGLIPAIYVSTAPLPFIPPPFAGEGMVGVDGRNKSGHDVLMRP